MNYVFLFALGIGFAAGLRSLTPPAVVAWAAHLGWLNLKQFATRLHGIDNRRRYLFPAGCFRINCRSSPIDAETNRADAAHRSNLYGRSLRRVRLRGKQSIANHWHDSRRARRSDRSIRRLPSPEKIGRRAEHQRYLYGPPRRSDHDRARLLLRHPLTLISAFQFFRCPLFFLSTP